MSGHERSSAAEQRVRDQVRELGGKFLLRTADQVSALREQLTQLAQGDVSVLTPVQDVAHKIHGTGAVFGFVPISECAGQLELLSLDLGKELETTQQPPCSEWARRLTQHVEELARALEAAQRAAC